jgi:hypothetical protein
MREMKKFFRHSVVDFLLAAVFAASVGIPVIHHFCMGTSEGVTVFVKQRCCEGSEDMPKDCCRDDVVLQQMNDNGILAPSQIAVSLPMEILLPTAISAPLMDVAAVVPAIIDTSPPPSLNIPVLYRSLLI